MLHKSIDELPVYNWVQAHNTGSLEYLIAKRRKFMPRNALQVWEGLYNEFYQRFGKTKEFLAYLQKLQKLTVMICSNALEFDSATDIHIHALQGEIDSFINKKQVTDFFENLAVVSKWAKYRIDPKTTTVAEYYGLLKLMEKEAKQQKELLNKAKK